MDAESIKTSVYNDGFFYVEDPVVGRRADAFAASGYPFQTEQGLDFLQAMLDDKGLQHTIEISLEICGLGMFKPFGPHPGSARALLNRTTNELLALSVLACRSGTRIILYKGSHKHMLDAEPGATGLLELPRASMNGRGITPVEVTMDEGGMIIADGRLFSTISEGVAIGVAFAVDKELQEWGKMLLPKMPILERKVAEMQRDKIKLNFNFVTIKSLE